MEFNKIFTSSKSLSYLFKKLDINRDGKIDYKEFVCAALPNEDEQLKFLASSRKSYYLEPGEPLKFDAERALLRVFEQELKNFRHIEKLKE